MTRVSAVLTKHCVGKMSTGHVVFDQKTRSQWFKREGVYDNEHKLFNIRHRCSKKKLQNFFLKKVNIPSLKLRVSSNCKVSTGSGLLSPIKRPDADVIFFFFALKLWNNKLECLFLPELRPFGLALRASTSKKNV
jgi:hypothetical protein